MIYSDKKNFFFIHNPKVAGTSVRKSLEAFDSSQGKFWAPFYLKKYDRLVDRAHIQASELELHGLDKIAANYFCFGFVRDPYKRFISAWDEFKSQHNQKDITDINAWALENINSTNIRYDWRYIHFCPQYYFFYDGDKLIADFVGRQESIESDWTRLQFLLGVSVPLGQFNVKKQSGSRLTVNDLSAETISLINDVYHKDFVYFNYKKIDTSLDKPSGINPYVEYYEKALLPENKLLNELNRRAEQLYEENDFLKNETFSLKNDLETLQHALNQVNERNSVLDHDLAIIKNSRSYKCTAPMRIILSKIRSVILK